MNVSFLSEDWDDERSYHSHETGSTLDSEDAPPPEIFENVFDEEDLQHWVSGDHENEIRTSFSERLHCPPRLKEWKEVEPGNVPTAIQITVGLARHKLWDQGKAEIQQHRLNVKSMKLPTNAPSCPTDGDKVYQLLFGTGSRLSKLFMERLEIATEEYLCFLNTYFKSCRYRLSVKSLHESSDSMTNHAKLLVSIRN